MATATARREQLRQFIDTTDDAKIDALFAYVDKKMEPLTDTYNKWDDPEFVTMIRQRTKALEDGTDKGFTWEEVKQRARRSINPKSK